MMGLSIGVHILNLLTIPALVFIYYFRKTEKVTVKGMVYATLIAGAILLFINNIIIPYTVYVGAMVDLFFVNTLGLPVNSGIVLFALALILGCGWAAWYTHRKGKVVWNIILLSTTMVLVGFSSYASVTIRAAANPPMNSMISAQGRILSFVRKRGVISRISEAKANTTAVHIQPFTQASTPSCPMNRNTMGSAWPGMPL